MIVDVLKNMDLYLGLHAAFPQVKDWVEIRGDRPEGLYELGNDNYLIVREGETRDPTSLFEAHDRYIDFEVMMKGAERTEWAPRSDLYMTDAVDPVKDIGFFRGNGDGIDIVAGMFYIYFPQDAHKNNCHTQSIGSCDFRKYIFKLRADQVISSHS
ncbi:MAG: hypothetical protein DBX44_08295 [Oscillospiraceae bacterium]|nr:MAG: hypothetical protein DBX44_08295 [Oscillospiraceae bacterium]